MSSVVFSFIGVQPIEINSETYVKLLNKTISFSKLQNIDRQVENFFWMKKYNSIYDTYNHLFVWDILEDTFDLKQDFFGHVPALNNSQNTLYLSEYLTLNEAKLYFDPRFTYFVLVYQINFEIPLNILKSFLDYDGTLNNSEYNDLYNVVRSAIVKESPSTQLSTWGDSVQAKTQNKIKEILEYLYKTNIDISNINILPNSCNISNFVLLPENIQDEAVIVEKLFSLNIYAERLTSSIIIEPLYGNTVYYSFNGRFHTIILKNKQDAYRFQPLQFHIQYMWFLVERYNKIMNIINMSLMQTDSLSELQKQSRIIHSMINKIELLGLHDTNFKHSIEVDIAIYEKNEERWSIANLLKSSKQYVSFFKDYLDRIFLQKNEIYQKKMNLILFVISFFQLLALVSVWNDYLATLNKNNLDIDNRLFILFNNKYDLLTFNLFMPLSLVIIMVIFAVYLLRHKFKQR